MAPRSPKRLAPKKVTTSAKKPRRKKVAPSFSCYRFIVGYAVHYYEKREEAMLAIAAVGGDGKPQKITVRSNAELTKLLRENTL